MKSLKNNFNLKIKWWDGEIEKLFCWGGVERERLTLEILHGGKGELFIEV